MGVRVKISRGTMPCETLDDWADVILDTATLGRLLNAWPVGRLATMTPAGDPHAMPVVFVALGDGCVGVPVDGKRKRGTPARLRNVEQHGRACLLLDHYAADWSALWWVKLVGPAWVERGDGARRRAEGPLRRKYPQYRDVAPFAGEPTLLVLRWERVACWTQAGDLGPVRAAADASADEGFQPPS